jgi:acyl carrier protein
MILLPAESVRTSNVMPREDTAKVIAEIVERVSGSPAAGLVPESTFGDDLGIDSLTMRVIHVPLKELSVAAC